MTIYLIVNAVMYFGLGVWCALSPTKTSEAVGFTLKNPQGIAEYIAVYGGLEFSLGLFFLIAALSPLYSQAGLLLGVLLYGCLALFRAYAMFAHSSDIQAGWNFFALEIALFLWSVVLWYSRVNRAE